MTLEELLKKKESKIISIWIDKELAQAALMWCKTNGTSRSRLVGYLLSEFLKEQAQGDEAAV